MAWRGSVLIVGDLIVLTIFSLLGRGSHGLTLGLADIARTGLPFAAAWLVVNLVSGGFRARPEPPSPGAAALQVILRYALAGPLALVGRSLWLDRPIIPSFAAVALSTSLTLLVAWRVLLAWWCARNHADGARSPRRGPMSRRSDAGPAAGQGAGSTAGPGAGSVQGTAPGAVPGQRPGSTGAAAAVEPEIVPARRSLVLASLLAGMFMAAIEATVIATAVPSIVGDLQGFHLFSWLLSAFTLAQAVTTPLFGRLSDIIGRKPVYTAGAGLFLLGSLLCGLSDSMVQLIIFRGVQGLGAGAIFPVAMTIVGDIYSPVERARIQGYLSSVWGISSVIGPALGGVLVSTVGWPWVFYINLPIGVVSVAMLLAFHRKPPRRQDARLDLAGAALLVVSVTSLIILLTQRNAIHLTSGPGLVLAVLAAAGLASFIYWERRVPEPLLPLPLITRPLIAAANAGAALAGVLIIALSSLVPLFVQGVLGHSPTVAGFSLAAMSIGWPLAATASGHLILRTGYRRTAALGAVFGVAGAAVLLAAAPGTSPFWVAAGTALSGAGFGLTTTPYVIAIQSAVPYQERGVTTASHAFARQLGQAVGAAVVGGFLTSRLITHLGAAQVPGAGEAVVNAVNQLLAEGSSSLPTDLQGTLVSSLDAAIHDTLWGVLALSAVVMLVARRLPSESPGDGPQERAAQEQPR